jgi:Zn-dependent protease
MIISPHELLNIAIMTVAVAFIFWRSLHLKQHFTFWKGLGYATMIAAPAIILHEFGHKFVALGFGLSASFEIPWLWLALGVVLAIFNAPIVLFVPAYIAIAGQALPWQDSLISFAGPAVNGIIYLIAWLALRRPLGKKSFFFWTVTKKINGFLFLFNMIPIPPLDGYAVFAGLLKTLGF